MSEVNGSKIWIRTPIISIQPGEFSKIVLIISIAAILVSKRELFATTGRQILGIEPVSYTHLTLPTTPYV